MMIVFVLVAGTLAAGAAVLLVLPLLRTRPDARPVSGIAAGGVLFVLLLGTAVCTPDSAISPGSTNRSSRKPRRR